MELEKRGIPTVTLATDAFVKLAKLQARAMGYPDLALVVIEHPLGGIDRAEVLAKVSAAAGAVAEQMTGQSSREET